MTENWLRLASQHPRHWRDNLYVYPVISRRSEGLSIGINLNPDKICNFNCVYCQIDRAVPPVVRTVDGVRLRAELELTVRMALSGELFADGMLSHVPVDRRAIRDIAFSGEGEPTTSPQFPEAVVLAADVRRSFHLDATKLVLITNATRLNRPAVREALKILDANNGEIWAKLDAGTEAYYQRICRSRTSFGQILKNISSAAKVRPLVIQSMWMNVRGVLPPSEEVDAFADHLTTIQNEGGRISLVQIYTIARRTAETYVAPLSEEQLNAVANRVRERTGLPVSTYL